jgi:hypothetical protein
MEALLRGKITTDASNPLDYMISGEHPYKWPGDEKMTELPKQKSDMRIESST